MDGLDAVDSLSNKIWNGENIGMACTYGNQYNQVELLSYTISHFL